MEEKRKKIIKITVIAIIAIVCIYLIFVIRKCCILNEVSKMQKENYHMIFEDAVNSSVAIHEYWKKDNISKIEFKDTNDDMVYTFWSDTIKKENYTFSDLKDKKMYKITEVPELTIGFPVELDTTYEKLKYALNPFKTIKTKKNNETKCYIFEYKYKIENNGNKEADVKKLINVSFDTVSNEDVALPDISDYELITSTN